MSDEGKHVAMSRAELLAVAGLAAPIVRRRRVRANHRVTLVDRHGKPTRTLTDAEVADGLLRRAGIELTPLPGVRPKYVLCADCGAPIKVKAGGGALPKRCRIGEGCSKRRQEEDEEKWEQLAEDSIVAAVEAIAAYTVPVRAPIEGDMRSAAFMGAIGHMLNRGVSQRVIDRVIELERTLGSALAFLGWVCSLKCPHSAAACAVIERARPPV